MIGKNREAVRCQDGPFQCDAFRGAQRLRKVGLPERGLYQTRGSLVADAADTGLDVLVVGWTAIGLMPRGR